MSVPKIETVLWTATAAFAATALIGARTPRTGTLAAGHATRARVESTASMMREIDDAAVSLVATDPFRAARQPSPIAYQPELEGAPPPPPRAARPALSVCGIMGGPPWSAVLEGVPGRDGGAVIHAGDTLGGLSVRAVKHDTVVITGADTTWRLAVRRAW